MKIPEIKARLLELAAHFGSSEIAELAEELGRRRYKQGPRTSRSMTPELHREVRAYAKAHPELSMMQIAKHFNINHGRVSEAVHGFRE